MTVTFFFYYDFGNFPIAAVQLAYEINQALEFSSYKHDESVKWTLKIEYDDLTKDAILNMDEMFREMDESKNLYDGWGADTTESSDNSEKLKDYYEKTPENSPENSPEDSPESMRKTKD
jgi:hypothetical protein